MKATYNLDDTSQTVFFLPFDGPSGDLSSTSSSDLNFNRHGKRDDPTQKPVPIFPSFTEHDLLEGQQLRLEAYQKAWAKCLARVQTIIRELYAPVVEDIVQQVHSSYSDILPGLPYPELPVICIRNMGTGTSVLDEVMSRIDCRDLESDILFESPSFTTHLHPSDCTSLMSAMKAIVTGFVEKPRILEKGKRKVGSSVANYDIEMLVAWYKAVRITYDINQDAQPKLVIVLHDFEQLDPPVIQDVFYICSLQVTRIPLVFILSLSSPPSPSYLHIAYRRSTLALLRIDDFVVPSGIKVLEEVLLKTFFDVEFVPDIMMGPGTLVFLADYFFRQHPSLDSILTILQLAHMKHFSTEPFSALALSTPSAKVLQHPASQTFYDALLRRRRATLRLNDSAEDSEVVSTVLLWLDMARGGFQLRIQRMRIGFALMRTIQEFLKMQGYVGLNWDSGERNGSNLVDVMIDVVQGNMGHDVKYLGAMIKKLQLDQFASFLEHFAHFLRSLPREVRIRQEEAQTRLATTSREVANFRDAEGERATVSQLARNFGEWVVEYLSDLLLPLDEADLWEAWYTGLTPFPAELLNPSVHASIVSGLLRPHEYAGLRDGLEQHQERPLWDLPDTAIVFHRYLESGKMINVYDWFESFHQTLDTQKKELMERGRRSRGSTSTPSPRKAKAKRQRADENEDENIFLDGANQGDVEVEMDDEKWRMQVQARFMRALHELDYLGFIKHTGRKADHVLRTVFDLPD